MKVIKYDSLASVLSELISQKDAAETATTNAENASTQAEAALADILATTDIDGDYISYTVGQQPDSSGASSGTIGAYFKEDGLFQKVEWDGSAWAEIGEPIVSRKYVDDKAALSTLSAINDVRSLPAGETMKVTVTKGNLQYRWDSLSELPDDGSGVIRPEGVPDSEPGRYILVRANQSYNPAYLQGAVISDVSLTSPIPVDVFDGYAWGRVGSDLYRSANDGESWELYSDNQPASARRLMKCNDGEVILVSGNDIYKSSDWGTGNPTWDLKFSNSGGTATFLAWGADGNGQKFVIGEYASGTAGSGWENSQKAWISTDAGDTWEVKFDSQVLFPSDWQDTHIHACCYDRWQDIFFVCEGHSDSYGIYWSDDNGESWNRVSKGDIDPSPAPTVMVATDNGIVCGSDSRYNGMYVLERAKDPNDMYLRWVWEWNEGMAGLNGFADRGFRDPKTGIVYISWRSENLGVSDFGLIISGSDGVSGGKVWESEETAANQDRIMNMIVTPGDKLIGFIQRADSSQEVLTGRLSTAGGLAQRRIDTGGVMGGRRIDTRESLAVGAASIAGHQAVAIGVKASAEGEGRVAVGRGSNAGSSYATVVGDSAIAGPSSGGAVVIGQSAEATNSLGVVIGVNSKITGGSSVAIGHTAEVLASSGVAIGRDAKSEGAWSVAIGRAANCPSGASSMVAVGFEAETRTSGVALGYQAKTSATSAVAVGANAEAGASGIAIGRDAKSIHAQSVALGRDTETARTNSVAFGNRDLELQGDGRGIITRSPDGTLYKITVDDTGEIQVGTP